MVEIFKNQWGEYQARIKAGNGQTLAITEGYVSKKTMLEVIESIRLNVKKDIVDLTK